MENVRQNHPWPSKKLKIEQVRIAANEGCGDTDFYCPKSDRHNIGEMYDCPLVKDERSCGNSRDLAKRWLRKYDKGYVDEDN